MNNTIGTFEIVMYVIFASLAILVSVTYYKKYKNLLKQGTDNINVDSLLNDYSNDMIDIVGNIIETQISDRSSYPSDEAYREDIVNKAKDNMISYLNNHTNLPKPVIDSIPDKVICNAILRVVDYIETVSGSKQYSDDISTEDFIIPNDEVEFVLDNTEISVDLDIEGKDDITDTINSFYND